MLTRSLISKQARFLSGLRGALTGDREQI